MWGCGGDAGGQMGVCTHSTHLQHACAGSECAEQPDPRCGEAASQARHDPPHPIITLNRAGISITSSFLLHACQTALGIAAAGNSGLENTVGSEPCALASVLHVGLGSMGCMIHSMHDAMQSAVSYQICNRHFVARQLAIRRCSTVVAIQGAPLALTHILL